MARAADAIALVHKEVTCQIQASFLKIVQWDNIEDNLATTYIQNIPGRGNLTSRSTRPNHPGPVLRREAGAETWPT
jgi:hypothetical protein